MLKTIAQWFAARRPAPSPRRAANKPSLETLEDRRCPAAWMFMDGTLHIRGEMSNPTDSIKIFQDDVNNRLTVIDNGYTRQYPSSWIKQINVELGYNPVSTSFWSAPTSPYTTTRNSFSYELVGTEYRYAKSINYTGINAQDNVYINMAGANAAQTRLKQSFHVELNTGGTAGLYGSRDRFDNVSVVLPKIEDAAVSVRANLGSGSDTFSATFLGTIKDASVTVNVSGNTGNDQMRTFLFGDLTGTTTFAAEMLGGAGSDIVEFRALKLQQVGGEYVPIYPGVKVGADATLTAMLDGGSGNDFLFMGYSGELDGRLGAALLGGDGDDRLDAYLGFEEGSDGQASLLYWDWNGYGYSTRPTVVFLTDASDDLEFDFQAW